MAGPTLEPWHEIHESLRRFIGRRVAGEAEAEDIVQEVFLRMHRKMGGLKDPERLLSWMYRIAHRAIIDHYRAPARRREVPAGLAVDMEAGVGPLVATALNEDRDPDAYRAELAGCLRPMIDRLAKDYREAVTLVELEGLTQRAAAKRLRLSLSGMKSRVQRGRQQLKRMLDECCLIQLDRRHGVAGYRARDRRRSPCGEVCG